MYGGAVNLRLALVSAPRENAEESDQVSGAWHDDKRVLLREVCGAFVSATREAKWRWNTTH